MAHVLARVQLRYGRLAEFNEIMANFVPGIERHGWKLVGAWTNSIGPLHEVWDLWEVDDANAVVDGLATARLDPDVAAWAARLPDVVEHEELRLLSPLPYSP